MSLPKTPSNPSEYEGFSNLEFTANNSIEDDPDSEDLAESTVDVSDRHPEPKGTKNFWWLIPVLGLVLAVGGVSVMRIRDKNSEQAVVTETAPLNVRTVAAQQSPIRNWVSSEGTVRAVRFKHLAFDIDGDVTYIADRDGRNLREGDRVNKGELLAQIDDLELQADVNKAQAAIIYKPKDSMTESISAVCSCSKFKAIPNLILRLFGSIHNPNHLRALLAYFRAPQCNDNFRYAIS